MSRVDNTTLALTIHPDTFVSFLPGSTITSAQLRVYAVNYNVLKHHTEPKSDSPERSESSFWVNTLCTTRGLLPTRPVPVASAMQNMHSATHLVDRGTRQVQPTKRATERGAWLREKLRYGNQWLEYVGNPHAHGLTAACLAHARQAVHGRATQTERVWVFIFDKCLRYSRILTETSGEIENHVRNGRISLCKLGEGSHTLHSPYNAYSIKTPLLFKKNIFLFLNTFTRKHITLIIMICHCLKKLKR